MNISDKNSKNIKNICDKTRRRKNINFLRFEIVSRIDRMLLQNLLKICFSY